MDSPVRSFRNSRQMSRVVLAALSKCSYQAVYAAEMGLPLTPHRGILRVLELHGLPRDSVMGEYRAFRDSIPSSAECS